ncbi:MAG: rhodanese-like domain-containing protein [Acidobacteriota bacterium]
MYTSAKHTMANEFEITPEELKARLDKGERVFILDVREPYEHQFCKIEGATLIPLGELPTRVHELDSRQEIVAYCHAGVRSANAIGFLYRAGFRRIKNLVGGIDAWACTVDPSMPRY